VRSINDSFRNRPVWRSWDVPSEPSVARRSGVTHEVSDDLIDGLAAFGRDPLEALCVLTLDADDDRYLPAGPGLDRLHVARINRGQLVV